MLPQVAFPHKPQEEPRPFDLGQMESSEFALESWHQVVGKNIPMQPHIAIYDRRNDKQMQTGGTNYRVVLRGTDGWRLLGWNLRTYEVVTDPAELGRLLDGLELVAGTPAAKLVPIVIPEPPSFDRRWLPPMAAIIDHVPAYRLRLQPTADGFVLVEAGMPLVPLAAPLLAVVTASVPVETGQLRRLRGEAVLRRDGPALRQRHARAIAALQRTAKALSSRSPQDVALLTPSAVLAAAGTDPSELASLCDGAAPDAARLDRLGFFHPSGWPRQHFSWLFPLTDGLFLECHPHRSGGCDLTISPYTPQRPPTAEELRILRRPGGEAAPEPEPPTPTPPSEF